MVLRTAFFLSFFGRIVSVLALGRRLLDVSVRPGPFLSLAPPPTATCGTELTVSVSTVIVFVAPSAADLSFPGILLYDCLGCIAGVFADVPVVDVLGCQALGTSSSTFFFPSAVDDVPSIDCFCSFVEVSLRSIGACAGCSFRCCGVSSDGVEGALFSSTVSKGAPAALVFLVGVLVPERCFVGSSCMP